MAKMHYFHQSLKVGQAGEAAILELVPGLTRLSGRKSDFSLNDELIELKRDTYSVHKTANLFIERWSNFEAQKPGGPWQSITHGSTQYWYFFSQNKRLYQFKLADLLEQLEAWELSEKPKLISVPNKGYTTKGYKVPRELLLSIAIIKDFSALDPVF